MVPLVDSWLEKSWKRSRKYKVDPSIAKDAILGEFEFKQLREKKESLLRVVIPKLNSLTDYLKTFQSIILVSDLEGCILESIGDPVFLKDHEKIQLCKGAYWSEKVRGTNTAGTTIVEQKPIAIVGNQHYLELIHKLYCTSSPIFDPRGDLVAVLNITGYHEKYHPSLLGMVDILAKEIEDWLLINQPENQLIIALDSQQKRNQRAILAVNTDGVIIGANREARMLGHLTNATIGKAEISEIFSGIQPLLQRKKEIHPGDLFPLQSKKNGQNQLFASIILDTRSSNKPIEKTIKKNDEEPKIYPRTFEDIHGIDRDFLSAINLAKKAAAIDYTILITGESGTGKDIVAQAIHRASPRSHKPFIAINCGAVPKSLLESELFGYEGGAFTGARQTGQPGKFEQAHGGTLFLDEIAEMPMEMQVVLLRVMQDFTFTRVGGTKPISVDVRIITATHTDLWKKVQDGSFRADLFYRLEGIHIILPPLRRRTDRLHVAQLLLRNIQEKLEKVDLILSSASKRLIQNYSWPGNVRQMLGALRSASFLAESGVIEPDHFPPYILSNPIILKQDGSLEQAENEVIIETINKTGGNLSQTSRILGIGRSTLYRKLKKLSILDNYIQP
ncbi:MAG TPA: sigma-54-dependent Fis family transcriptional regulator [Bacillota bacterium]|nr:sigma-54-dependent Fis family transcriptional regulator [Bacillota bacterium]